MELIFLMIEFWRKGKKLVLLKKLFYALGGEGGCIILEHFLQVLNASLE